MKLVPKNWVDFQHYKDRAPPWIKLHKSLIDDRKFQCLPVASRALAPMLWLIASEEKNGEFDGTPAELAFRLRQTEKEIDAALKPLISNGFFIVVQGASDLLAECKRDAIPEERQRESKRQSTEAEERRATRLPPDWQPDSELMAWATNERPDLNIGKTLESFRDHWKAAPGKSGTKMDWPATFRNWVRKERKAFQATTLAKTFAERDRDAKRAAWEARTGQKWPDDQPYTLDSIVTVVTTGENHVAAIKGH